MRRIENLSEITEIELKILKCFDAFCKRNNLKYSLASGTMLGAVRHKGFIPWDDDIDIFMCQKEYLRFAELVKQECQLGESTYKVCMPESEDYIYPFIKIIDTSTVVYEKNISEQYKIGVWIDIFPIIYCGDTELECKRIYAKNHRWSRQLKRSVTTYPLDSMEHFAKNIYILMEKTVLRSTPEKMKNRILRESVYRTNTRFAGTVTWPSTYRDIYPADFFDEYIEIEFEGCLFSCFKKYKEILTWRYGDYMKLPREEERTTHGMNAFYK